MGLVGFSQNVIVETKGKLWYLPNGGYGVDTIQSYIIINENGAGNAGMVIIVGTDTVFLQLDGSGNYFIKNQTGDITFLATGGDVISKENFTIGDGTDNDFKITFIGNTSTGILNYDEDNADFEFDQDVNLSGLLDGNGVVAGTNNTLADTLEVTGDVNSSSITVNGVTADTIITLANATGNLANSTTELDTIFTGVIVSGVTIYSINNGEITAGGCYSVADDASITLPDATTQRLKIHVDNDNEWALVAIQADGTVTLPATVGSVVNTDTDTNLCIFDSGTGATIRNRLGSTKTVCYTTKYKE